MNKYDNWRVFDNLPLSPDVVTELENEVEVTVEWCCEVDVSEIIVEFPWDIPPLKEDGIWW